MAEVFLHSPNQNSASPKYRRIADELKDQITRGVLAPDDRLPSYIEMRSVYATTQSTIEKAIALLESEGLIIRKPGSGIYVTEQLKAHKAMHGTVGLVLPRLHFPKQSSYWVELLQSVHDDAQERETQVLLLDCESLKGWEKADGVLLCEWGLDQVWRMIPAEMPCVSLLVPTPDHAAVVADDYIGGRLATEHLLQLGHRRIAYLHNANQPVVNRRRDGYRDALLKAGIEPEIAWERTLTGHVWLGDTFMESGYHDVREWLRGNWSALDCTALLAHNDETALGAIRAFQEARVHVPDEVSVVGFDGTQRQTLGQPNLTTIEVPLHEIGIAAMELLWEQIRKNRTQPRIHKILPTKLRVGDTTAAPKTT